MTATAIETTIYNGEYTITNAKGEHKTLKVKRQKDDARFAPGERIVQLLTGSDNEFNYTGFGFVKADGKINVWRKKQGRMMNYLAVLLTAAFAAIEASDSETVEVPFEFSGHSYTVLLSKRCLRCNRKLTNPESIRLGIGPECAGKGL